MTEASPQPNLGTLSANERDQFYAESKCVPTTCERAHGLPRVRWLKTQNITQPFRRVIELGCHDGFSTRWLLDEPHIDVLVGIELSSAAVKCALELAAEKVFPEVATYIHGSIFDYKIPDELFDGVVCFELLEHFPPEDSRRLLRLCHALCVEGGRVFLTTPHIDGPFGKDNPDPAHIHFYNEQTLAEEIKQETGANATVVNIEGILHARWGKKEEDGQKEEESDGSQGQEDSEGGDGSRTDID